MKPNHLRRRSLLAAGLVAPAIASMSWAQGSPASERPEISNFFKRPQLSGLRLSPDGKSIAAVRDYRGRQNITVVDVATRKATVITSFTDGDASGLGWVNDNRLMFSIVDLQRGGGDQVSAGLFVIDRDGKNFKPLVERSFLSEGEKLLPGGSSFHSRLFADGMPTDEIVMEVPSFQAKGKFSSNLYRLNTSNGRKALMTLGGPGDTQGWIVDRQGIPRAAISTVADTTTVHYRDAESAAWRTIFQFKNSEPERSVTPLGFDSFGVLYVSAYLQSEFAAIYRFNDKTNHLETEPVFAAKGFDIGAGLRFSSDGKQLLGVDFDADRPVTYWFDPSLAALQAQINEALPGKVNRLQVSASTAATKVLIHSYSDRDPGRYLLFDKLAKTLEQVGASRPWINPEQMQSTQFYRYAARDGLSIPAQITTPPGKGPFPLVVLHYGGPWVRAIEWQWDPHVQFLVSRGYAVFMPAPRASTGFGVKLFKAGWKQWGLAMQDDVTDGVKQLIAQGVADPKRVCIAGASYGGYLTMMGLAKEPALFRCGVNWVGVTDPGYMFSVTWTDFNRIDAARFSLPLLLGDPDKDAAQFAATSPVQRAKEITQPVLMAYGGLDQRVPIINGEKMRAALAPHNKQVKWMVFEDEAHGWVRVENNISFWSEVEKFLAEHLKG